MNQAWVLLTYRARRDPSRHRVAVWRQLKAAGALYLQDSVCALPNRDEHRALFERLAAEILDNDGTAVVLVAQGIDEHTERSIEDRFNAERGHDYAEITEQCEALLEEFRRETGRSRFSFAALEDTESNLDRLRRWLERVARRDFFDAPDGTHARDAIARCEAAYETFSGMVLEHGEDGAAAMTTDTTVDS
ncbi:chromate resistance protein ChrB [Cryobacterium sp. TMT1-19]|uniref:Chromate resistance protein ChrB n=1 Tax=unclassified Cryobacterium TaxID=2649013 RepID=UPI00106ABFD1|nr:MULTISPECIES: Chromate resistance protein ChrB [unclassified Cryobacterium]TFD38345.1 chromate resistance protein ChrB [Cryobacterium sp. TMT1-19]